MSDIEALDKLIEAVKAGTAKPHNVFNYFDTPCQDIALQQRGEDAKNAYNDDMNAALSLKDALLPGWIGAFSTNGIGQLWEKGRPDNFIEAKCPYKPARALLLATLKGWRAKLEAEAND